MKIKGAGDRKSTGAWLAGGNGERKRLFEDGKGRI